MQDCIWREVLQQAYFGCVFHKLVTAQDGKPNDYIFLYINPAFEEMTGLRKDDIIGKRASQILSSSEDRFFDWDYFYAKAKNTDQKVQFTRYLDQLKRWYRITAYQVKEDHFVSIFQDVTLEMERIKALEENEEKLKELARELDTIFNTTQDAMFLARWRMASFII